ncbi:ABC transporter permease [Aeromicrobium endophyticum]|uniref:Autoinducer 2 import system permease protein LsrD n=1 Tax=Aeromicrobium endophyticum TaxID=2292704 RepID=A0A371NYU7_9ACTN|nr:ABC transporter permease [Aeromicrobium endophyticum]REK68859.1 ABC transporter permease [Aeromicrobium endophyticum]
MTVQHDPEAVRDDGLSSTDTVGMQQGEMAGGRRQPRSNRVATFLSRYALILVWALLATVYCVLMPDTFMSTSTLQAIFGSQSALVLLALAALSTFVAGEFDLSFASIMGLSATIVPVLTTLHGVPIGASCLVAMVTAMLCGLLNAFFVVVLEVPSLVVTLGSASLFVGIAQMIASSTIASVSEPGFSDLVLHRVLGLPLSFYYGALACVLFAYVITHTPLGRHIVFVGANRDVARLAGVRVSAIRAGSYVAGSTLAGLAGVVLVASVGGFDPAGSAVYLLPSLAAVFLGTAVVLPGQFNPIGTFVGIYFLATGIIGLQLLGYSGWVQDVFYGGGLVLAVSVAAVIRRRVAVA